MNSLPLGVILYVKPFADDLTEAHPCIALSHIQAVAGGGEIAYLHHASSFRFTFCNNPSAEPVGIPNGFISQEMRDHAT